MIKKTCDHCKEAKAVHKTPNHLFELCDDCYFGLWEDMQDARKEMREYHE
jgi:hypothetical protein